ncbi:hypothetical protein [Endozoicomonas sp. ONNA2]|uniref:hypothetical protein n=1 Tax=Endozoicomonas sp. ONNA2 TaxID=2828741 RepID=UPI0021476A55|nr:hypothetical protein [Endozoicomonas sp. ONNA2]
MAAGMAVEERDIFTRTGSSYHTVFSKDGHLNGEALSNVLTPKIRQHRSRLPILK